METIIYDGAIYILEKASGNFKVFTEKGNRRCLITDSDNNVQVVISTEVVGNVGFVRFDEQ